MVVRQKNREGEDYLKKLAVFIPGTGYTCEKPLLKGLSQRYEDLGYDIIKLNYGNINFQQMENITVASSAVRPVVLRQMAEVAVGEYERIVFVSKSLGTMVAMWLEDELNQVVNHVLLTPTPVLLPYIGSRQVIAAVLGTEDHLLKADLLKKVCEQAGVPCLIVEGVGHKLEREEEDENERILQEVLTLCAKG